MSQSLLRSSTLRLPQLGLLFVCCLALVAVGCASGGMGKAAPVPDVVGVWNLVLETPMGTQEPTFTVTQSEGMLMGMFSSPQGELEIPSIVEADNAVSFDMTIEAAGQEMELKFTGTVEGDNLTGSFSSPFGDMPVTGTRAE